MLADEYLFSLLLDMFFLKFIICSPNLIPFLQFQWQNNNPNKVVIATNVCL